MICQAILIHPALPWVAGEEQGEGGSCECKFSITIDKDNTDIPVLRGTGARKTAHPAQGLATEV